MLVFAVRLLCIAVEIIHICVWFKNGVVGLAAQTTARSWQPDLVKCHNVAIVSTIYTQHSFQTKIPSVHSPHLGTFVLANMVQNARHRFVFFLRLTQMTTTQQPGVSGTDENGNHCIRNVAQSLPKPPLPVALRALLPSAPEKPCCNEHQIHARDSSAIIKRCQTEKEQRSSRTLSHQGVHEKRLGPVLRSQACAGLALLNHDLRCVAGQNHVHAFVFQWVVLLPETICQILVPKGPSLKSNMHTILRKS